MNLSIYPVAFFTVFSGFAIRSIAGETPIRLQCLWASYQNFKITADKRNIVLPNGREFPWESRVSQDSVNPKNLTSIDQMYMARYPYGFTTTAQGRLTYPIPTKKDELRCSRYEKLFLYLYGTSASMVERDLVPVRWVDGSTVLFNRRYGGAQALRKVVYELYALSKDHPEIKKYLRRPLGGTYEWRKVAGSKNMSMHAFGTAIDINVSYSNYWRWEVGSDGVPRYRNGIPPIIAQVFEDNGFAWGGKWYHYDTMHFEYRPELLMNHDYCRKTFAKYRD